MHKLKRPKSKPLQIKYQIMIIFNEQTEKWREKLTGSNFDMMMVRGLSLLESLPNTDSSLIFFFFFLVITNQAVTNEKEIHLKINAIEDG